MLICIFDMCTGCICLGAYLTDTFLRESFVFAMQRNLSPCPDMVALLGRLGSRIW